MPAFVRRIKADRYKGLTDREAIGAALVHSDKPKIMELFEKLFKQLSSLKGQATRARNDAERSEVSRLEAEDYLNGRLDALENELREAISTNDALALKVESIAGKAPEELVDTAVEIRLGITFEQAVEKEVERRMEEQSGRVLDKNGVYINREDVERLTELYQRHKHAKEIHYGYDTGIKLPDDYWSEEKRLMRTTGVKPSDDYTLLDEDCPF